MEIKSFTDYINEIFQINKRIDSLSIDKVIDLLVNSIKEKQFIYLFGNGGSGAAASHFCEDLGKGTLTDLKDLKRFRVLSLTDNISYILAWANDHGFDTIFEQQLKNLANPGDIVIGISGSGKSQNVINALKFANSNKMITVGFTGFDGGEVSKIVKYHIHVPSFDMGIVENVHNLIMHYLVDELKKRLCQLE